LISNARPSSMMTPPIPTTGLSGYSRAMLYVLSPKLLGYTGCGREGLGLTFRAEVYNTPDGEPAWLRVNRSKVQTGGRIVLRCPECSAEIDVDEDEVEEGEILSCPECETELEVSQTHPVALNPISDELEEEDEEDLEEEEEDEEDFDEDGDLLDEDEEDEDEEE